MKFDLTSASIFSWMLDTEQLSKKTGFKIEQTKSHNGAILETFIIINTLEELLRFMNNCGHSILLSKWQDDGSYEIEIEDGME